MKTLQNIEDKSEEQLKIIGNKNVNSNDKAFDLGKAYNEIEEMDKKVHYRRFVFVGSGNHRYDFFNFLNLKDFFDKFFSGDISLNDAKYEQRSFHQMIWKLDDYNPAERKYEIKKENTLSNVKIFYKDKRNIVIGFKKGKYQLPKKYALDKFTFNESEKDASKFLLENRIKSRFQKEKIWLWNETDVWKREEKNKIWKQYFRRNKTQQDKKNLMMDRLAILFIF